MGSLFCFSVWRFAFVLSLVMSMTEAHVRKKRIVGGKTASRKDTLPLPTQQLGTSSSSSLPQSPIAILYDETGEILARVTGRAEISQKNTYYYSFLGIRYAEPPVGYFRFQRARKIRLLGEVDAKTSGAPCLQKNPFNPLKTVGSEDCLFLNVYTPKLPESQVLSFARSLRCEDEVGKLLPVMVWNHGGGHNQGSASQYGPKHLMDKDIIVVTIQYRLGPLGFLSHMTKDSPGNVALYDQLTAMEWVKENIEAFGGDPNRITLAGHDAGASAAMLLSQSKYGHGLFRSVVAMSGTSLSAWATAQEPEKAARSLASSVKCPTNDIVEAIRCMQQVSAEDLIMSGFEAQIPELPSKEAEGDMRALFSSSGPVIDGPTDLRFLPTLLQEDPKEGLKAGSIPKIPLLTGITKDETSNLFSVREISEILERMKKIPGYLNKIFLPQLVKTTRGLANISDVFSGTLTNFLAFFPGEENQGPLKRLIEASSDALFALPAFVSSSLWDKAGGPVYLYSFDHPSPFSASIFSSTPFKNISFIGALAAGGTPEQEERKDDVVGHGEDLFYLFQPKSIDGENLPKFELTDAEDLNVLDLFTSTIAEFVKTGNPSLKIDGQESTWLPFSEEQSNYLSISSKPKVGSQFKFCEMGLWSGITSRLLTPECKKMYDPLSLSLPSGISGLLGGTISQKTPKKSGLLGSLG